MNSPRRTAGAAGPSPAAAEQRLQWLFRGSLRRGQIHPMLAVMRRYRQVKGEAA
jgi:hypothetical protein